MKTQIAASRKLLIFIEVSKGVALLKHATKTEVQILETQSQVQQKRCRCVEEAMQQ